MRRASRIENVSFYLAFLRLTSPIPGKGKVGNMCHFTSRFLALTYRIRGKGLRVTPTMCHFTRRLDARPGQSMVRVAFPTEASELAPALGRIFKLYVRDLSRDKLSKLS